MVQNRENKLKYLTGYTVTKMFVRTGLTTDTTRTCALKIFVGWKKEAAP